MRRKLFMRAGALVIAGVGIAAWQRNALARWLLTNRQNENVSITAALGPGDDTCLLTPESAEGPYFATAPQRTNIREDRKGIILQLELEILKMPDCNPVAGATVEIWHCDAGGQYSGYNTNNSRAPFDTMFAVVSKAGRGGSLPTENEVRFLRGSQISDDAGKVRFETIFPGWYDPRVPHIHVKVSHGEKHFLTAQLYFEERFSEQIYATHPDYAPGGPCPYNADNDIVLGQFSNANGLMLQPTKEGGVLKASARFAMQ